MKITGRAGISSFERASAFVPDCISQQAAVKMIAHAVVYQKSTDSFMPLDSCYQTADVTVSFAVQLM